MEKLLEILEKLKPGVDFRAEEDMIENGILDSIEIMELTDELMDAFEIDITPVDIVPENFKSAETLYQMIVRLQED